MMYKKEDLIEEIKMCGIKNDDVLMIHSSFSSIKNIEGGSKSVISAFKNVVNNGVLLFPTHTWVSIKNDGDILDLKKPNSCVGYLTNEVILDPDFVRSKHPTHSVCAYGPKAIEYIKDDVNSKTPVSPNGSFGKLKFGGKILFIGCPLSKNTFVHSVEEEMNVPDRFTSHIYTFYSKSNDIINEFHMPRHYNELCPHISDNYEKLLPIMLNLGIAKKVKILDSLSYLVDAYECRELVIKILKSDIHAFDDLRDIKKYI